ncbi:MAG: ABC transporter permease [Rhodobacterales bacterium]|nr:MAG: ABC transporter permease [Rhodobacterales bacterium]
MVALLLLPVAAGLIGTLLPAFGGLRPGQPAAFSLAPWAQMSATPGIAHSAFLSLKVGLISTALATGLALLIVAGWHGTRAFRAIETALSPLLSVPHAAAALGLAFLIAPSGWLLRVFSPALTGWSRPPDLLILQDPGGWSLIFGLVAKELPFLLLMLLAALPQARPAERMRVAFAAGYGRVMGWALVVLPSVYAQLRLPVYAVLAYGMSNVDMALVLGPSTPPMLSVTILRWMSDPDLALRAPAAAAALVQLALVLGALGLWRAGERGMAALGRWILWRGPRGAGVLGVTARGAGLGFGALAALAVFGGLASHLIWSFAGRWRFPEALPEGLRLRIWARHGAEILDIASATLLLAFAVALVALLLVLASLEAQHRRGWALGASGQGVLYLPLILPQITFLPGLQILLLSLGAAQGWAPVFAAHLVFVLPYTYLSLSGPFRAWDSRLATLAASLGAGPNRVFWRLRLPMLAAPLLTALAVGMAVSVGQYLPTLLASGGRVTTLTTEALALASGGDRRVIGAWALALTVAAWAPFALAIFVPRLLYRRRKGVLNG